MEIIRDTFFLVKKNSVAAPNKPPVQAPEELGIYSMCKGKGGEAPEERSILFGQLQHLIQTNIRINKSIGYSKKRNLQRP